MIAVIILIILTTAVLVIGLVSMAAGKNFNKKYGTKLMGMRVILQFLALLSLAVVCLVWSN